MSIELEDAKTKVAQFQKQCEEYLVVIVQQKRDADEQQKVGILFHSITSLVRLIIGLPVASKKPKWLTENAERIALIFQPFTWLFLRKDEESFPDGKSSEKKFVGHSRELF